MIGRMMASAIALTGVAYAQETTPPATAPAPQTEATGTPTTASADRVVYDAAYFAQYNPQNALDMVRQVPGFALDGGEDRRGFSGAVGNLLIDNLRPSTKSQSVEGILSRIPANQVVRIEVLRGAAVAGDASGQSTLVNIVRTPTAGSGTWEGGFEYTSRDIPAPRGEASYSGRNGNTEWGLGASYYSQYRDLPGWRRIFEGDGNHIENVDTPSPREFREAGLTGNLAFSLWGGRLGLNSSVDWFEFHADNDFHFTTPGGVPTRNLFTVFDEKELGYEIGLNYDRDFGPWSMNIIGLINRARYESEDNSRDENGAGVVQETLVQELQQDTGESIARGTLARPINARNRIEFGGEVAFNSLDQGVVLIVDPPIGDIPNDNILIEEARAEVFVSEIWRPSDAWSLETRVAWETSTLTFSGDTDQEVALSYWKPSAQLTRTFGGNDQWRVRYYRDVGQLDFGDFTSAVAVADELIAGGNPDLVPQTQWIAELGLDLRFPRDVAVSLVLSHHQVSDVADLVPIVDDKNTADPSDDVTFDAPGNIGDAEYVQLDANISTPIPFIPGSRLSIEGYLRDSEVTDPVTGDPRIISFFPESEVSINFRQDITAWRLAWGIEAYKEGEVQAYRLNEIDTSEEGPWVDLFIETTALPNNMKLQFWAANIFDGTAERDRRFFGDAANPNRNGPLNLRDLRQRQFASAPWFIVIMSGQF